MSQPQQVQKLPKDATPILLVKSLPYKTTSADLYTLFGKYGAITQIRLGNTNDTRGRAFVVYEATADAVQACQHLNGYSVGGRYIVVLYFQVNRRKNDPTGNTVELLRQQRQAEKEHITSMKTKLAV